MNITFINPPAVKGKDFIREGRCMQSTNSWVTAWPPISMATLAAIGRKQANVQLIDCIIEKMQTPDLIRRLEAFHPDIIVLNTAFPSIEGDHAVAATFKQTFPKAVILSFGVFFTLLEKEALDYCPAVDAAIVGEPEETFEEFAREYARTRTIPHIKGLMWREGGRVEIGTPREPIDDLDRLPFPARDLLKNNLYVLPDSGHPFTLINSARGCCYSCIYCIAPLYYGKKVRRHSLDYLIKEIKHCKREFGLENFLFWEEMFTFNKELCMQLCDELIGQKVNIKWAATTRADCLDREVLLKMKQSGCILLGMGIESGNEEILKAAKKKENLKQIKEAVMMCKEIGIPTMGHFIFGLPGETKETAEKTIHFALTVDLDYIQCYSAVPYPKTELGELAKQNNWLQAKSFSQYDFGGRSILDCGTLRPEEVDRLRQEAFRRFYFRPGYILRKLKALRSPTRILNALKFVKWIRSEK